MLIKARKKLSASDYKIIKAQEYASRGLEPPYDMDALHAEREALRQEIRELTELKKQR